jgi:hypothetical protein
MGASVESNGERESGERSDPQHSMAGHGDPPEIPTIETPLSPPVNGGR